MYIKTINDFCNHIEDLNSIIKTTCKDNDEIVKWCKHPDIDMWDNDNVIKDWCKNTIDEDCKKWKMDIDKETDEEKKCALKCKFASKIQNKVAKIIWDNNKDNNPIFQELGTKGHETSEIASWIFSLPVLADILHDLPESVRNNAQIVLEASYGTSERADAVIVGTNKFGKAVMIFIENKRWQCVELYEPKSKFCVLDHYFHNDEYIAHPCVQVWRYAYLMKNTNKFVQVKKVETYTAVLMHNVEENKLNVKEGVFDKKYSNLIDDNPVFIGDKGINIKDNTELKDYIKSNIEGGTKELAEDIYYKSKIQYSAEYVERISTLFCDNSGDSEELKDKLKLLLDKDQLSIFEEISEKVNKEDDNNNADNEKAVYILEGRSGTGKSFLALALLSYFYIKNKKKQGPTAKCLLKNNDLRKYFIKYFGEDGQKYNQMKDILATGTEKELKKGYDCIICDESQRMPKTLFQSNLPTIDRIIEKSKKVSVFFWDSRQSVSIYDYIKRYKIEKYLNDKSSIKLKIKVLKFQHRASDEFLDFLNDILYSDNQENVKKYENIEEESYVVRLVKSPMDLKNIIGGVNQFKCPEKHIKNKIYPSRMLAGKGCSGEPQKDWCWLDYDDNAIGPLGKEKFYLMWDKHYNNSKEFSNIQSYALDSKSDDRVGCVDSSQGLDFEYVGVIIAPDLYYNGTNVEVDLGGHRLMDLNLYNDSVDDYQNCIDDNGVFDKDKYIKLKQKKYGEEIIEEIKALSDEELNMFKKNDEELNKFIGIIQESDENEVYEKLGKQLLNNIIKNTYNVLLSRGVKGCYIYCCDKKLEKHLNEKGIKYYESDTSCKPCNTYIGDKNGQVFHMEDCLYVQNISEKETFNTSEDAISEGYKPCTSCKPCKVYIGNKRSKILHAAGCSWLPKKGSNIESFSREEAMKRVANDYQACKVCQRCNKSTNCPYFKDSSSFCPLLGR